MEQYTLFEQHIGTGHEAKSMAPLLLRAGRVAILEVQPGHENVDSHM